jgi:hypothetical protein
MSSGQTFGGGGIIGFEPPVEKPSILLYKKKNHYNEWEFTYSPLSDQKTIAGGGNVGGTPAGSMGDGSSSGFGNSSFGGSNSGFGSSGSGFGNSGSSFGGSSGSSFGGNSGSSFGSSSPGPSTGSGTPSSPQQ